MTDFVERYETKIKIIQVGDIVWTWCGKHGVKGDRTDHRWDGHKLICLYCERKKLEGNGNGNTRVLSDQNGNSTNQP